jgi:hypothetical protein
MLRRKTILTTAALLAAVAVPASAQTNQDLRSPDAKDAAEQRGLYQSGGGGYVLNRDYGSPDAADVPRDLQRVSAAASPRAKPHPGPYTDSERELVESPEVQAMVSRAMREIRETPAVVEVSRPSGSFDWGDAGLGAAGMLTLCSIAAGAALIVTARRRRRGFRVATH